MKKIIPLLLAMVILTGCSARSFAPVISTEFDVMAVYKAGDFSYNCQITRHNGVVTITSLSGYAKGTSISFDGNGVTFKRGDMEKTIQADIINGDNPAMMIYQVFDYLEKNDELDVIRIDDTYQYTGNTKYGTFVLVQKDDNSFATLSFPEKSVEITFCNA